MLAVLSFDPDDGLYWLYALLPVAVGFFAEQLRLVSTEQVLERLELEDADAVRELPRSASGRWSCRSSAARWA